MSATRKLENDRSKIKIAHLYSTTFPGTTAYTTAFADEGIHADRRGDDFVRGLCFIKPGQESAADRALRDEFHAQMGTTAADTQRLYISAHAQGCAWLEHRRRWGEGGEQAFDIRAARATDTGEPVGGTARKWWNAPVTEINFGSGDERDIIVVGAIDADESASDVVIKRKGLSSNRHHRKADGEPMSALIQLRETDKGKEVWYTPGRYDFGDIPTQQLYLARDTAGRIIDGSAGGLGSTRWKKEGKLSCFAPLWDFEESDLDRQLVEEFMARTGTIEPTRVFEIDESQGDWFETVQRRRRGAGFRLRARGTRGDTRMSSMDAYARRYLQSHVEDTSLDDSDQDAAQPEILELATGHTLGVAAAVVGRKGKAGTLVVNYNTPKSRRSSEAGVSTTADGETRSALIQYRSDNGGRKTVSYTPASRIF